VEVLELVGDGVAGVDSPKSEDRLALLEFDGVGVSRLKSEARLELLEFEELEPENKDSSVLLTTLLAF
jgi:hypothetical protein